MKLVKNLSNNKVHKCSNNLGALITHCGKYVNTVCNEIFEGDRSLITCKMCLKKKF